MNDTRARLPETETVLDEVSVKRPYSGALVYDAYLGRSRSQKVVNLLVCLDRALEILNTANLGLNQVVTVHGGRNSRGVHAGGHELQNSHLCGEV